MKKLISLLLIMVLLMTSISMAANARESKMSSELAAKVEVIDDREQIAVAVWTVTGGNFNSSLELVEYASAKAFEETGLTPGTCRTIEELDHYNKVYNRIIYDLETANIPVVIEKLALTDKEIIDRGGEMLIARLTKEQIAAAAALDEVTSVELWNDGVAPVEPPTEPDDGGAATTADPDETSDDTAKISPELLKKLSALEDHDTAEVWIDYDHFRYTEVDDAELEKLTNEKVGYSLDKNSTMDMVSLWKRTRVELMHEMYHQKAIDFYQMLGVDYSEIDGGWDPDNVHDYFSPHLILTKEKILALSEKDEIDLIESYQNQDVVVLPTEGLIEPTGNPAAEIPTEPSENPEPVDITNGDADGDGEVTILDATCIQRYLVGLVGEDQIDLTAADCDGDRGVTILDATRIQRWLAGL